MTSFINDPTKFQFHVCYLTILIWSIDCIEQIKVNNIIFSSLRFSNCEVILGFKNSILQAAFLYKSLLEQLFCTYGLGLYFFVEMKFAQK